MDLVLVLCLGLVIGSFLNVVIYRVPLHKSIVYPGSACGTCSTQLKSLDLIPVVSFLLLKGRCRYCLAKVSWRYPLVELLTGLIFASVYIIFGVSWSTLIYFVFVALLISVAFIDYDHKIIPNSLNIAIALLALLQWAVGLVSYRFVLYGGVLGFGVLFFIILLGAVFKVQAMGMGDLKLMISAGLFLGPIMIIMAYLVAFFLGGVFALVALVTKRLSPKDNIAFGPFLSLGLGLSLLLYPFLIKSIL